jgi:hypothetical protein
VVRRVRRRLSRARWRAGAREKLFKTPLGFNSDNNSNN